jgi:outer membrane protein assembly factor BamB
MAAEIPLIDLDRPPPPPAEAAVRFGTRPILLVAALIAALLTLGGAAPAPPGLTPVLTLAAPIATFELTAGSLFAATSSEVRRYDLPSGKPAWRREFDRMPMSLRYDAGAGVLLALSTLNPRLTGLDAATGEVLWSTGADDTLVISFARGRLLTQHTDLAGRSRLRLTDARTGLLVWTREVDPTTFLGPDVLFTSGSPTIVAVGSAGEVVVLSYADGSVLAHGDLELAPDAAAGRNSIPDSVAVSVVGDRLYLARRLAGRTSLTAYAVPPLTEVWRTTGGPIGTVTDCGPVLCVADTRWVSAIDPAGGAPLWAQPAWGIAYRYDATRLFAYDNQEETGAALLDALTGRVLRRLGTGRQLGDLVLRLDGTRTWVSAPDCGKFTKQFCRLSCSGRRRRSWSSWRPCCRSCRPGRG